ncbi:MAG: DNRLRE domain-containing protein [Verrucomicrobiaceae bacterium]|nr:DNRLRE domain-containing protein [Verrucomicrobiaceae bacterium]
MSARATAWAGGILRRGRKVVTALGALILLGSASAHNLNQQADYIAYDDDTLKLMQKRQKAGQPLIQVGDVVGIIMKATPTVGTPTGAGGYSTFFIPVGTQVVGAEYGRLDNKGSFKAMPMKGQSLSALGDGARGSSSQSALKGLELGPNVLGAKAYAVDSSSGRMRGTITGVYSDTGIFYSTDPKTAWQSWVNTGGFDGNSGTSDNSMTNNSGDVVIPTTRWDAEQLLAFGVSSRSPIVDVDGKGNTPWGLGSGVAGPQSGYGWHFDFTYWNANPSDPARMRNSVRNFGPWKRIRYAGSMIAKDTPGLVSTQLGLSGEDASKIGWDLSTKNPLPPTTSWSDSTSPKAVRMAWGNLEIFRPEYARVQLKINVGPGQPNAPFDSQGYLQSYADTFGGDAGGEYKNQDHIWRYYEPSRVSLTAKPIIFKQASKQIVTQTEVFTYTIWYTCMGNTALTNVVLEDTLPSGIQYISASRAPNSTNPLRWNLGTVQPGTVNSITLTVRATGTGVLTNTICATSDQAPRSCSMETIMVSNSTALLYPDKTVTPSIAVPGSTVTYTLTMANEGSSVNTVPLTITENLPVGFTYQNMVSAKIGKGKTSAVAVNASNPAKPIFTVNAGIPANSELELVFRCAISATQPMGTYTNQFTFENSGKVMSTGGLAPVTVGGGRIGDQVFRDWNGNGVMNAEDDPLPGVQVQLYASNGTTLLQTTSTGADGKYDFAGLQGATYIVRVTAPAGHTATYDLDGIASANQATVTISNNEQKLNVDFGYRPGGTGSIGDSVFKDIANDGSRSPGDPGIPNVTVNLYEDGNGNGTIDAGDAFVATASTNSSGGYLFGSLATGLNYVVEVNAADGDLTTYFSPNSFQASTATRRSILNLSGSNLTADFGFWAVQPGSIGDQVFADVNGNSVFDAGTDSPLVGVKLNLSNNGTPAATTTSGADGKYLFTGLGPSTYQVSVDMNSPGIPAGYSPTLSMISVALAAGENDLTADFPFASVFNKSVDKVAANAGEVLNYTLAPYWPGPSLLTNAKINDLIPAGTTYTSSGQGGVFGPTAGSSAVNGSHAGSVGGTFSTALTSVADNESWSEQPTTNYGTANVAWVARTPSYRDRVMLRFDLSSIPSNATITSAVMTLNRKSGAGGSTAITAHRLTQAWAETTSSWNNRSTGTPWSTPGGDGDYDATAAATTTVNANGAHNWNITSLAQSWVNGTNANHGMLMRLQNEASSGEHEFYTREEATASRRPTLSITYTIPGLAATTTAISVAPGTVTDTGSGVNVSVSMNVIATAAVTGIRPSALAVIPGTRGSTATLVSGPTSSPASIGSGGGSATFTWVYKVSKAGTGNDEVTFRGNATGSGAVFSTATSNGVVVNPLPANVCWNLGTNTPNTDGAAVASSGGSFSSSLTSVADNETWTNQPTTNYGTANVAWVARSSPERDRVMLSFDLSAIPANATITSAVMTLTRKSGTSGSPGVSAHRLTQPWSETTSSWNNRSTGTPWTTPGGDGDYDATAAATTNVTTNAAHNWTLTSLVQNWVNGTNPNHGILMRLQNESVNGEHEFYTREEPTASRRPTLSITYTTPSLSATTTSLSVSPKLVTAPASPATGVNVNVSITVTAAGAVSGVSPTALTVITANGATATLVSGPVGAPATISAGAQPLSLGSIA